MPNQSGAPLSVDELVAYIVSLVDERYRPARKASDGALLAEKVRRRYPELRYEALGLAKLADAIAKAEAEGLLIRNRRVKHLEVLPTGAEEAADSIAAQLGRLGSPHIRPDIWRAFVFVGPGHRYYFDRQTGNVLKEPAPDQVGDATRYVEIPGVSLEEQQQWMTDFLNSNGMRGEEDAPIDDPYCFTKFPLWLHERRPGLDRQWKQLRVHRVGELIRKWSSENGIDSTEFFSAPLDTRRPSRRDETFSYERAIRDAIISAARELPLDELQDLAIPLRYVLNALRGR